MLSFEMLQPVVALLLLNCFMMVWLYIERIPAIKRQNMRLDSTLPKGEQMSMLPARVRWKADNYNHLLEQPVLFYAVCFVFVLLDQGSGLNLILAWLYVGLRVVHSFYQALWNVIPIRFALFAAASLVLMVMIIRAALVVF